MITQRIRHIARKNAAMKDFRAEVCALAQEKKIAETFPVLPVVVDEPYDGDGYKTKADLLQALGVIFNADPTDEGKILQSVKEWVEQQEKALLETDMHIQKEYGIPIGDVPDVGSMSGDELLRYINCFVVNGPKLRSTQP